MDPGKLIAGISLSRAAWSAAALLCAVALASVATAQSQPASMTEAEAAEQRALDAAEAAAAARIRAQRLQEAGLDAARRLAALGQDIVAREQALSTARTRLQTLRIDVADAEIRLAAANKRLAALLREAPRAAREPTPSLLAYPDRPVAAARSALVLRALSADLRVAAADARTELDRIATATREARALERVAQEELAALRTNEVEVAALADQRRTAARAAAAAAQEASALAERLRLEADDLNELVAAIVRAPRPRRRPDRSVERRDETQPTDDPVAAPAPSWSAAPLSPPSSARAASPTERIQDFADARGAVLRPVAGRITASESDARAAAFLTDPYARVIAPWDGEILFADDFLSYGKVVIIEPQSGWQIVLTGLAQLEHARGDRIVAGEPIGRMGGPPPTSEDFLFEVTDPRPTPPQRLELEIRRNNAPIDAKRWLETAT